MKIQSRFARMLAVAFIIALTVPSAFAAGQRTVHQAVARGLAKLHPLRRMNPTNTLDLCIGLPLRNREALTNALRDLYDPASPHYHQWLTPTQFTAQFGPTEEDYQKVVNFARANGFTIKEKMVDRHLLSVSAPVADIEKAFHVTMHVYQHPAEARQFHSPDTEPWVDSDIPIQTVANFNDFSLPHPKAKFTPTPKSNPSGAPARTAGSAPDGSGNWYAYDFRVAYFNNFYQNFFGEGQYVGLMELGQGFYVSDINRYATGAGGPQVTIHPILMGGYDGSPGADGDGECELDIEMAIAMAPGLSGVYVFEAPNSFSGVQLELYQMTQFSFIKQLSCSWGIGVDDTSDDYLQQFAAQGQSFFLSSGDSDAYPNGIWNDNYPTSDTDPYLTSVGGTQLQVRSVSDDAWIYDRELVWNDRTVNTNKGSQGIPLGYWGSTGGYDTNTPIPSWQVGAHFDDKGGSASYRNVPDVALTAVQIYAIANNGHEYSSEGTSAAAPLWAGYMALINQHGAMGGNPPAGFINPKIYSILRGEDGMSYSSTFNDVVSGDNSWSGSGGKYSAGSGADNATGLGSPQSGLVMALSGTEGYFWVHDPNAGGGDGWWFAPVSLSQATASPGAGQTTVLLNGSHSPGARRIATPMKIKAVGGTSTIGP